MRAASSKRSRLWRAKAHQAMPRKVAKQASVAMMRRVVMSIVRPSRLGTMLKICPAKSLFKRSSQALQIGNQRVHLGLVLDVRGRLGDLGVGIGHADRAQSPH